MKREQRKGILNLVNTPSSASISKQTQLFSRQHPIRIRSPLRIRTELVPHPQSTSKTVNVLSFSAAPPGFRFWEEHFRGFRKFEKIHKKIAKMLYFSVF